MTEMEAATKTAQKEIDAKIFAVTNQLDRQDKNLQDVDEKTLKLTDELSKKIASSIAEEHRFIENCLDKVNTQLEESTARLRDMVNTASQAATSRCDSVLE